MRFLRSVLLAVAVAMAVLALAGCGEKKSEEAKISPDDNAPRVKKGSGMRRSGLPTRTD